MSTCTTSLICEPPRGAAGTLVGHTLAGSRARSTRRIRIVTRRDGEAMLPRQAEQRLVTGVSVADNPPHSELAQPLEEGAEQLRPEPLPLECRTNDKRELGARVLGEYGGTHDSEDRPVRSQCREREPGVAVEEALGGVLQLAPSRSESRAKRYEPLAAGMR
jgi:hypothetical protein